MKTTLRFTEGKLWIVAADLITFGYTIHKGTQKNGVLTFLVSLEKV